MMINKSLTVGLHCALFMAVALASGGCSKSSSAPEMHEVKGVVKYANGKPLNKGTITLRSKSDTKIVGSGTIASDGTFDIKTSYDGKVHPGAPPGEYSVMVMIEIPDETQASYHEVNLQKTVTIAEKENKLNIIIPNRK